MFNKRDEMDAVIERHLESYAVMLETSNYVNREEQRMIYKEITKDMAHALSKIRKLDRQQERELRREKRLQRKYAKLGRFETLVKLETAGPGEPLFQPKEKKKVCAKNKEA